MGRAGARKVEILVEARGKASGLDAINKGLRDLGRSADDAVKQLGGKFKTAFAGLEKSSKELQQQLAQGFKNAVPAELDFLADKVGALPVPLLAAAGAAGVAGKALFDLAKSTADVAIQYDILSQKTGLGVETLSTFTAVANDAEISTESVNTALTKFADNLFTIKGAGANVEAELFAIADLFQRMPDGPEKTAIAINAFGRSGADLIPVLNGGSAAIKGWMADMSAAGRVVTTEGVESAKKLDDALDALNGKVEGLKMRLGTELIPVLTTVVDLLRDAGLTAETAATQQAQLAVDSGSASVAAAALARDWDAAHAAMLRIRDGAIEGSRAMAIAEAKAKAAGSAADLAGSGFISGASKAQASVSGWLNAAGGIERAMTIIAGAGGKGINVNSAWEGGRLAWRQISDKEKSQQAFIAKNRADSDRYNQQIRDATKAKDLTAAYQGLYNQIEANKSANERYGRSWDDLTKVIGGGGSGAIKQVDEQLKALEDRMGAVKSGLGGSLEPLSKNEKLQQAFSIATGELSLEQFQLQQALKATTKAQEEGTISLEQALTAALSIGEGIANTGDLFALAGDAGKQFAADQAEVQAAVDKATKKIGDLKGALGVLPDKQGVDVVATIKGMADLREAKDLVKFLDAHDRHTIYYDVVYRTVGQPPPPAPPGYASGGVAEGWAWVGERGPELVFFNQPSRVFSAPQSADIANSTEGGMGGAGVSVTVNIDRVNDNVDVQRLAWQVADEIQRRRTGRRG
jgi:hypothetical protein